MTKTKRIQILCLLGAVTLLLSGCWTEAPVESANGLLGDQEPADQQEEVILPAAFTLPYDPDQTLDPVTCADGMQQVAGSLIYEGLFRLDRQLEPQPWLCQSYTYDAASLTYTFTLRSGVTFSDGSPLTAADAAATLRRAKSSQRYSARLAHVAAGSAGDAAGAAGAARPLRWNICARIFSSSSSARSGLSIRNWRALSRPWPMRSPSMENQLPAL